MLVASIGRHTVVANQRLGENEDLTTVGGIGHGFGVSDERRGEDSFTGDVGFGTKRLSGEDGSIL